MKVIFRLLTILPLTLCLTGCEFISNTISSYWKTYKDKSESFLPPEKKSMDHCGKVITAVGGYTYKGIPVTGEADLVECPKCEGEFLLSGVARI
ncbi:hypothetical protein [Xenorhabdus miraniensis]|uniref:PAAR repeat-containing protein n=1 Tax=Xenorhabdus miraniensis TaxID=351674 RepID=A0A2D0JSF6_9GAMM|nr:hypothetical protein [Xenorhabdus miraniensis]PHM49275.1 PAAR repeat-containing protein [Xenorhabdus miraniensis]